MAMFSCLLETGSVEPQPRGLLEVYLEVSIKSSVIGNGNLKHWFALISDSVIRGQSVCRVSEQKRNQE